MAKKKQERPIINMGAPEWMVTFGDMMTLLLCFFVLLFAMSTIDAVKMKIITSSIRDWAGIEMASRPAFEPKNVPGAELEHSRDSQRGELREGGLADQITRKDIKTMVQTLKTRPPVAVTTGYKLLFGQDNLELTAKSKQNLKFIAKILRGYTRQRVNIIGHAKSTAHLNNPNYTDPYQLGYERARKIHDLLTDKQGFNLDPKQFMVTTVGMYYPPVSPSWEEADYAENDRVEIIVTKIPLQSIPEQETEYRYNLPGGGQ